MNKQIGRLTLIFFLGVALATASFTVGIYEFGWENGAAQTFVKIVPLPAAIVNRRVILLAEIFNKLEAYEHLVAFQSGELNPPSQKDEILGKAIENKIVEELARKRGVRVIDNELDEYEEYLWARFKISPDSAPQRIKDFFGLPRAKFIKLIVKPDLLRAKLAIAYLGEAKDTSAYKEAKLVADNLRAGLDFAEAAKFYSDDEDSKYIGGDLGFVAKQDLPPWLSSPAFSLTPSSTSEIVTSREGYEILQVVAKDDSSRPPRIQVRHILIKSQAFEKFFESERRRARVYIFSKN